METATTNKGKEEARIVSNMGSNAEPVASGDSETHVASRMQHTPMAPTVVSQPVADIDQVLDAKSQIDQPIEIVSMKPASDMDAKSSP